AAKKSEPQAVARWIGGNRADHIFVFQHGPGRLLDIAPIWTQTKQPEKRVGDPQVLLRVFDDASNDAARNTTHDDESIVLQVADAAPRREPYTTLAVLENR